MVAAVVALLGDLWGPWQFQWMPLLRLELLPCSVSSAGPSAGKAGAGGAGCCRVPSDAGPASGHSVEAAEGKKELITENLLSIFKVNTQQTLLFIDYSSLK